MIEEDNIFINKILDKQKQLKNNDITYTNFLDMYHIALAKTTLRKNNIENFLLEGGFDTSERKVLFFFNNEKDFNKDDFFEVISIRKIKQDNAEKLNHRQYLGAIIKCNLDRDLIGDINVLENGADIITLKKFSKNIVESISLLNRFSNYEITIKAIDKLEQSNIQIESKKIIIASYRLDNFVSDIVNISRSKASQFISQERVFLNGKVVTKPSKEVRQGDIITIRGKGRFVYKEDVGTTRSKRHVVLIDQYV